MKLVVFFAHLPRGPVGKALQGEKLKGLLG
jgi:hypothetical protein